MTAPVSPPWRPMLASDIAAVSAVAARVHPGFFESDAVFAERQRLAPEGCWLLEDEGEDGGGTLGYVLAHPYCLYDVPPLDSLLGGLPAGADCFYIHDLALLPQARGTGAAAKIVEHLIGVAGNFPAMGLVAVNDSLAFWSRFGFTVATRPALDEKLATYDGAARYMIRPARLP